MQSRIPKRLEAHFHQDFGMGVANTIMALDRCNMGTEWPGREMTQRIIGQPPMREVIATGSGSCEVGILIIEMAIANPGQAITNANRI